MRRLVSAALLASLAACGPSRSAVRQYVAGSPHRIIAVLPFDPAPSQRNPSVQAADLWAQRLKDAGFTVVDFGRTRSAFNRSAVRGRSYDALGDAVALGDSLGAQAVLVGRIDEAMQKTERRGAVYQYTTQPPPACCNHQPACASHQVYDALLKTYVDSCTTVHRRVQTSPAQKARIVSFAERARLIEVPSGQVLWESDAQDQPVNDTLYQAQNRVTDVLAERLMSDLLHRQL